MASNQFILVDNTSAHLNDTVTNSCAIIATIEHFAVIGSRAWNVMILLQLLYLLRVKVDRSHIMRYSSIIIHVVVWLVSIGCAIAPYALHQIGPGWSGCNVRPEYKMTLFYSYTLPITIFWCISLFVLYRILRHQEIISIRMFYMRSFTLSEERNDRADVSLLLSYTITTIILWLPLLILRWMDLSQILSQQFVYFDIIIIMAQGIINAVIWLLWNPTWPRPIN